MPIWQGSVGTTLDFAKSLLLVDVEQGKRVSSREIFLDKASPWVIAQRLLESGVGTVICGAVSRPLSQDLAARGIEIIPFVSGKACDVLQAFMNGALGNEKFLMAGCGPGARREWACRRRRGRAGPSGRAG